MTTKFSDFKISPTTLAALDAMGFIEPTGIQVEAVPVLLDHPGDFIGQAQTGTGKTAAFGIPLLERIDPADRRTQAIVLAPTRELAVQIADMLGKIAAGRKITPACIYGGQDILKQIRALQVDARVVVGTPGRVNDHLRRHTLDLAAVRFVVLDEADEMLSMGFQEEIEEILSGAGPERRTWLFSATMPPEIMRLTQTFLKDPKHVRVAAKQASPEKTVELYYLVPIRERLKALCRLIDASPDMYGIVFCQTKVQTDEVAARLADSGYPVSALHGDMSQGERDRVMKGFRTRKVRLLIATDVAARGLDVEDLTHVINYSLPWDVESYLHRVGRTGRAGKEGVAVTFIDPREEGRIRRVESHTRKRMKRSRVPGVAEVMSAHVERLKTDFEEALKNSQEFDRYIGQLAPLADRHTPQELLRGFSALLCREIFERYEDDKELGGPAAFDVVQTEPVEIFLSVGAREGTTAGSLVAGICTATGLNPRQIGRISIKDGCSFVTLDATIADAAIEALNGIKMGGRTLKANRSRLSPTTGPGPDQDDGPRRPRPPVRSGPPAPRKPFPGRKPAGPRRPPR